MMPPCISKQVFFLVALRKRCNENMEEHEKLPSLNNVSSSFALIILSPFNNPVKLINLSFSLTCHCLFLQEKGRNHVY